jgi:hypothetical protein
MHEFVHYCVANDKNAPDFISDLIEEELITTRKPDLME